MDKYKCKFHPKKRCGAIHTVDNPAGCVPYAFWDICPFPNSRQKDAPPIRTNLDVAVEAWKSATQYAYSEIALSAVLKALHINPEGAYDENAWR